MPLTDEEEEAEQEKLRVEPTHGANDDDEDDMIIMMMAISRPAKKSRKGGFIFLLLWLSWLHCGGNEGLWSLQRREGEKRAGEGFIVASEL